MFCESSAWQKGSSVNMARCNLLKKEATGEEVIAVLHLHLQHSAHMGFAVFSLLAETRFDQ